MQAYASHITKEDVPDDRNPWTCPTEPPNIPPIRNRMTPHAQRSEGTSKEDISDDENFLGTPTLLGNDSSNTLATPAYQKDQQRQNLCKKELVCCINKANQTAKATLLEGSLTEPLNLGGTPDDKDPLTNKETFKLSPRLGINANDHQLVLKNAKHIKLATISNKTLSLPQSKTTTSITKDLSQMQRLSDQSNSK